MAHEALIANAAVRLTLLMMFFFVMVSSLKNITTKMFTIFIIKLTYNRCTA